jgi:hypothetical protein
LLDRSQSCQTFFDAQWVRLKLLFVTGGLGFKSWC